MPGLLPLALEAGGQHELISEAALSAGAAGAGLMAMPSVGLSSSGWLASFGAAQQPLLTLVLMLLMADTLNDDGPINVCFWSQTGGPAPGPAVAV